MLRNFLYINESALDGYLSSLEDGLRQNLDSKINTLVAADAKLKVPILDVGVGGNTSRQSEEATSRHDTSNARYERLRTLALADQVSSEWIIIKDPDSQLPELERGSMIEIDCDAYIPDSVRTLSSLGNIANFANQIGAISDLAGTLNIDTKGLPDSTQLDALSRASSVSVENVVVGEVELSDTWRMKAKLDQRFLVSNIDGRVTIVGKLIEKWSSKEWRPLLELKGVSTIGRQQRRSLERTAPAPDQEGNWLEGPAFSLEVLAIYI